MADNRDLVTRTFERVLGASRSRSRSRGPTQPAEPQLSGAGPDERDPQLIANTMSELLDTRGWNRTAREARLLAEWERLVGSEVAAHARPTQVRDGELIIVAESSSWATQLSILRGQILARVRAEFGTDVVRVVRVHGPAGARAGRPSRGERRAGRER